jgi:hypothetical protein
VVLVARRQREIGQRTGALLLRRIGDVARRSHLIMMPSGYTDERSTSTGLVAKLEMD